MIATIAGIPVFNAIIDGADTGMFKISLVDDPAVMSNFQAFDKEAVRQMYAIQDEEKRLVRGVVMRADFPIYRRDEKGEYYILYKAEQIRIMAEKYLAESRQNDVNAMHKGDDLDGIQMVQYFIKGDGVSVEGFDDCADGSLFAEFHILNDDTWSKIKDGTYKGFSLEGYFFLEPSKDTEGMKDIVDILDGAFKRNIINSNKKSSMSKLSRFKAALAKVLQEFGNITTDRGILAWDGEDDLKIDDAVSIEDAEGNRTPAEDGEYKTEDGKTIVVADGKVAEIKDPEAEVAPAEPEVEEAFGSVATDKGELIYEGEEDLKVGDAVFVAGEDGENAPAADGDYLAEDGKVITVAEGIVTAITEPEEEPEEEPSEAEEELRKENEALRKEIADLKAKVAKMSKMSAAKPAHQAVKASNEGAKTGIKGLDNLSKLLSAK